MVAFIGVSDSDTNSSSISNDKSQLMNDEFLSSRQIGSCMSTLCIVDVGQSKSKLVFWRISEDVLCSTFDGLLFLPSRADVQSFTTSFFFSF